MRTLSRSVPVLLALLVAACGLDDPSGDVFYPLGPACDPQPAAEVPDRVWDDARVIPVRVRQGEFTPMLLELQRNEPSILRFTNGDAQTHHFRAGEFFGAVSVAWIETGESVIERPCPTTVDIPARGTAEVHLVPLRDGHFDFENAWLPLLFSEGAAGTVVIR